MKKRPHRQSLGDMNHWLAHTVTYVSYSPIHSLTATPINGPNPVFERNFALRGSRCCRSKDVHPRQNCIFITLFNLLSPSPSLLHILPHLNTEHYHPTNLSPLSPTLSVPPSLPTLSSPSPPPTLPQLLTHPASPPKPHPKVTQLAAFLCLSRPPEYLNLSLPSDLIIHVCFPVVYLNRLHIETRNGNKHQVNFFWGKRHANNLTTRQLFVTIAL